MKTVKCPNCKKETEYSQQNPFRPFCSERCQLIDLGQWADEKYTIPAEETPSVHEGPNVTQENDDEETSTHPYLH